MDILFSRDIASLVSRLSAYPSVYMIADRKIWESITEPLVEGFLRCGVRLKGVFETDASERLKNLRSVEKIHRFLIKNGADRNALILALGGGITTDLAGFAAATYKRGVRYANIPTTLLAMADAAIGGKTGCNIAGYKNMCGAFLMPEFTFIDTDFLETLPEEEFKGGLAEVVKTFLIGDAQAYRSIADNPSRENVASLVPRAAAIKAKIVEKDFKESGPRRLLNLGHTYGHAIEKKSKGTISHGRAVAMGIIMAAGRSEEEGVARKGLKDSLVADFNKMGLPVESPWSEKELFRIMRTDKKAEGDGINFVLIRRAGSCIVRKLSVQ